MNCTSCNEGVLIAGLIEGQFRAHQCATCHGHWILIEDFVTWKEENPKHQFSDDVSLAHNLNGTKKALLCPQTGTIMRKFRISGSNEHRIDYSSNVGGLWLEQGEWELLKSENIANSLNSIVTKNWQKKIREQNSKENFDNIYNNKFGQETYQKVKEFRDWLETQEHKSDLRAYLFAEDPYSAEK